MSYFEESYTEIVVTITASASLADDVTTQVTLSPYNLISLSASELQINPGQYSTIYASSASGAPVLLSASGDSPDE